MSDVPSESTPPRTPSDPAVPARRPGFSQRLGLQLNHRQSTGVFLVVVVVGLTAGGVFLLRDSDPAPSLPTSELSKRPRLIAPRGKSRMRYVQDEETDMLQAQVDLLEDKVGKLEKALKAKDEEHDQALTSAALLVNALEAAQRHHALHGGVYGGHYRISVLVGFTGAPVRPFVRVVWLPLEDGYDAEAAAVANRIAGYVRAYTTRVDTVVERDRR